MNKIDQNLNLLERQLNSQNHALASPLWRVEKTIKDLSKDLDQMSATQKERLENLCSKGISSINTPLKTPKLFSSIQSVFNKAMQYELIPVKLESLQKSLASNTDTTAPKKQTDFIIRQEKARSVAEALNQQVDTFNKEAKAKVIELAVSTETASLKKRGFSGEELQKEVQEYREDIQDWSVDQLQQELRSDMRSEPSFPIKISPFTREPITNLEKAKGLTAPAEKFAKLLSYERFNAALRSSFSSTLSSIIKESPNAPPPYIVMADEGSKSTNWVVSQTLDLMAEHPPVAIVPRANLKEFLKNHPEIKHTIMMDDGSYSGSQVEEYIDHILESSPPEKLKLHICIPFMTNIAKSRVHERQRLYPDQSISLHKHQVMHTYEEMQKLGYFGYTKMDRPDVRSFLQITPIQKKESDSPELKKQIDNINSQIALLQKNVFKQKDSEFLSSVKQILSSLPQGEPFNKMRSELSKALQTVKRAGVDPELSKAEASRYNQQVNPKVSTTLPLWMAHKSADYVSTDTTSMRRVTQGTAAIPPYKEKENGNNMVPCNRERETLVKKLQEIESQSGPTLDESYASHRLGKEQIVVSNRGCFLLADNYLLKPDNNTHQLTLTIDGHKFPFGGQDGLFQYKLTEGLEFSLEKPGEAPRTFKYADGQITRLQD